MKSRAILAVAVLSTALVSGGWLVERGLIGSATGVSASLTGSGDRAHMFAEVMQHVARDYVDTLSDSTIYRDAAEGLIGELGDPHSNYLPPKLAASLSERTTGRYAGVGIQVDARDGYVIVAAPLPGGPALAAGIQAGDRITEVDGKDLRGAPLDAAQKALRGEPNSVVRVTIERPGVPTPLKFALTRKEIHVRSVQHAQLLGNGVGYVALTIFSEESAADLRHAIDSLRGAGMQTLIFDLRGDPGGLLTQGVAVSDLFLNPNQRIVSIRGRTPQATATYDDREAQPWPSMPLVVLVDSNTASAAEIVSGALQDHDRAVLLGTTTYGKGSAQNVFQLANGGAAKLTTALWFTPSGRSINRKRDASDGSDADSSSKKPPTFKTDAGRTVLGGGGITPDVIVPMTQPSAADSALQRGLGKQIPSFRDAVTEEALSLKTSHAVTSPDFVVTPAMRAALRARMKAHGVTLDDKTFETAAPLIDRLLGYETARYAFGDAAEYARRVRDDQMIARAVTFARGAKTERELLDRAKK
ncbi:MAG TPA: S41 family peptidase [Gemmatimonadaceae bacterium]|nr:S41 family peptidase [Gemmatimonadaceae bacterium]